MVARKMLAVFSQVVFLENLVVIILDTFVWSIYVSAFE